MKHSNPLKWYGGKHYLAKHIVSIMPPHVTYCEPYFGGGSVLFAKPLGASEVVNDLNRNLMTFWEVLRGEETFRRFVRAVEATPFSEKGFKTAKELDECLGWAGDITTEGLVMRAWAFFVRFRQSRQAAGKDFATLSVNRKRAGMNEQASAWWSAVAGLQQAHERLRGVVVLNSDALEVIRKLDSINTLFYLDPPYLEETRITRGAYKHEMSDDDHRRLLELLENGRSKFILSGYRSQMYDVYAKVNRWYRTDIEIDNKASGAEEKELKTECLWTNFEPVSIDAPVTGGQP